MKCQACNGKLEAHSNTCPYCGVRQSQDLKTVNFRDLGQRADMPCPGCDQPLDVIELETDPTVEIERCLSCHGMFFNPGELEHLLASGTTPLVWMDHEQLRILGEEKGRAKRRMVYRKCPVCAERMHHTNFGGRSGVILDQCGIHGVWLDGGELRQLMEWWRAGGKFIHQEEEAEKARMFGVSRPAGAETEINRRQVEPAPTYSGGGYQEERGDWKWDAAETAFDVLKAVVRFLV